MLIPRKSVQSKRVNAFLEIRNSRIHGQGLFARRLIRKGARLIEYVGELVTKKESNRRGLALHEESQRTGGASVYIFELTDTHDLDGDKPYNHARLANHSCDPNCEFINEDDRLFMYALREIEKGEEITFDYGYDIAHFLDHPCRCGSANCAGYIVRTDQRKKLRRLLARKSAKKVEKALRKGEA
ncbi:MAG: SET domain-containing protein-lysine N-methyltransferase [Opitutales bacterium]|nr:SET domain-containing protein-lysine N-methyltransferase [Opitutales bacterium]